MIGDRRRTEAGPLYPESPRSPTRSRLRFRPRAVPFVLRSATDSERCLWLPALALVVCVLAPLFSSAERCLAGPLPAFPPVNRLLQGAWPRDDGIDFEPLRGRWERVEVDAAEPASERRERLDAFTWWLEEDGFRDRAGSRAADWLRLGQLELGDRRIRASKEVGERLRFTSFTGYQASSQRMIRVDYQLRHRLVLRSEARERGESRIVLEREQSFR